MTTFAAGLAQRHADATLALQIEGLPYAFGNFSADSTWFASSAYTFEGVRPWLSVDGDDKAAFLPVIGGQRADLLRGRVSIGTLRIAVEDVDGSLAGYMATRRTDAWLRVLRGATTTTVAGSTDTVLNVADASVAVPGRWVTVGVSTRKVANIDTTSSPETITLTSALSGGAPGTGVTVESSDLSASSGATRATVTTTPESSGAASDWPASGTCWLGTEACAFTRSSDVLTLTRGRYRSRVREHRGDPAAGNASVPGAIVTQYPRGLIGRWAWLRLGLDADNDGECGTVFAGQVTKAQWDGHRRLVLELEDSQAWLRRPIFTALGTGWNGKDGQTPVGELVAGGDAFTVALQLDPATTSVSASNNDDGDRFAVRVGEQALIVALDAAETTSRGRPVLNVVGSADGRPVVLDGYAGEVPAVAVFSKDAIANTSRDARSFATIDGLPMHPLHVLLALLLSTGAESNDSLTQSYAYDGLPSSWGLGIPIAEVDVTGIQDLAQQTPALTFDGVVIDAQIPDARDWIIKHLLQPYGLYLRSTSTRAISVGWLRAITGDDVTAATTLTLSDVIVDANGAPLIVGPEFSDEVVAGPVEWRVAGEETATIVQVSEDTAGVYVDASSIEVEVIGVRDPNRRSDMLTSLLDVIQTRYALPPAILRVSLGIAKSTLNVGDIVDVTLPNVPNIRDSSRGLTNEIFEVWSKRLDLRRGLVELELAQSGLQVERTRTLAPACIASGGMTGAVLPVTQNTFTLSGGSYDDTDAFADGDIVRLYSSDLVTQSPPTSIVSRTATSITLADDAAALGVTPASGWVLMHANWTDTAGGNGHSAATKARRAWRAGSDELLGTNDVPHLMV